MFLNTYVEKRLKMAIIFGDAVYKQEDHNLVCNLSFDILLILLTVLLYRD